MTKVAKRTSRLGRREWLAGYLFILPNFLGFLAFTLVPVLIGFYLSMTDYTGYGTPNFVGISNYTKLFGDDDFLNAFRNNLFYTATSVPATILIALLLALMMHKKLYGAKIFQTVYFFPNLTSAVAVGCVWLQIFASKNGPVNQMLVDWFGVVSPPKWFSGVSTAMTSVVIVVVWKQVGYYMVMLLGGLKNIPPHLYEAAKLDGAGPWQSFWHVTWPMLTPTTFMVTILTLIGSFQVFDIINITTEGGPGRATEVLVMRIYKEAFKYGRMGYGAAIGYVLFAIIFIITVIQWQGQKHWVVED